MSFYVNLSSKDSLDIHSENHGGDFQVEMGNPLLFDEHDPWEVALAEITYDAQGFPNVATEYTKVKLEILNRAKVYDCTNKDLSITAYLHIRSNEWRESDSEKFREEDKFPKLVLPKKYYTWDGFKDAWTALAQPSDVTYFSYGVSFTNEKMVITFKTSASRVQFVFSDDLIAFMFLDKTSVKTTSLNISYQTDTLTVGYSVPIFSSIKDNIIFPEGGAYPVWIEIQGHCRFTIPSTNYTMRDLVNNIETLTDDPHYKRLIKFHFHYWETTENYQWKLMMETYNALDITLQFSWGFRAYLGIPQHAPFLHLVFKNATPPTAIMTGTLHKASENPLYTLSIPHNFYPTAQSLCDWLNKSIMSVAGEAADAKEQDPPLFSMQKVQENTLGATNTGKCVFKPHPFFKITLHPFLLKLLHLENTDQEQIGNNIVLMPSATREFLYVYTNIIPSHTYSGATNILRVINNNSSAPNERVMITFPNFYYHLINQLHITNIRISITDHYTDFILPFEKEVNCLLHFRRCNNIHLA